jgi:hypothetical protein
MKCLLKVSSLESDFRIPKGRFDKLMILNVYCDLKLNCLLYINIDGFNTNKLISNEDSYTNVLFLNTNTNSYAITPLIPTGFDNSNLNEGVELKLKLNFESYNSVKMDTNVIQSKLQYEAIFIEYLLFPAKEETKEIKDFSG